MPLINNESPGSLFDRINMWLILHSKVNIKDKVIFYRLLATMIHSGISLVKALKILQEQMSQPKIQYILKEIVYRVEGGQSFSTALASHEDVFGEQEIGMIKSGEISGTLSQILLQIADQIDKSAKVRSKIRGAMMYPIFVLFVMLAVAIVVMIFVIPKLSDLFASANVELPILTKILIGTSNAMIAYTLGIPNWVLGIVLIILAIAGIQFFRSTYNGKYLWDRMLLMIPVFGGLVQKVALAQFCRGLSTLTSSGISIVRALQIVSGSIGNEVYRRRILLVADDVKKGITIGDNLRGEKKLFPTMVVSMISVAEKTARIHEITEKIADFYESEVDTMSENLSKLMEPFIILIIGGGVAMLVAAVMLPIMQIADVASQG